MLKAAFVAVVMALAFTAVPAFPQPAVVAADPVVVETPVVTAEEPVVIGEVPVVVEEPTFVDKLIEWGWVLLITFGASAAALFSGLIWKLFPGISKAVSDENRKRLDELVLHGLFWAWEQITKGRARPEQAKALAVQYTQLHGTKELKALGADPTAKDTVEALEARAAKMLTDPAVPTPAGLTPPEGKAPVAAVISPPKP